MGEIGLPAAAEAAVHRTNTAAAGCVCCAAVGPHAAAWKLDGCCGNSQQAPMSSSCDGNSQQGPMDLNAVVLLLLCRNAQASRVDA